jgi:hypothetical protein
MTLQQLIHRAITDPAFRAALESKQVDPLDIGCTAQQAQVAAIALRFNHRPADQGRRALGDLLDNNVLAVPGWRHSPAGSLAGDLTLGTR